MAEIIVENREFTDRQTGMTTNYEYYAVSGTAIDGNKYEVQLKNLVQSEKVALKMLAGGAKDSSVTTRKARNDERPEVNRSSDRIDLDDEELVQDNRDKGMFD